MSCEHARSEFAQYKGEPVVRCNECGKFRPFNGEWPESEVKDEPSLKRLESALSALASLDLNDVPYHLQEDLAHISNQAHAALEDIKKGTP